MDKIVTTMDYAKRRGCKSVREYIGMRCEERKNRGAIDNVPELKKITGKRICAELNFGRWVARCECGGAEVVDPSDPVFYCFSCGNFGNKGNLRPVVFPNNWKEIEKEVLKRPIKFTSGANEVERLVLAQPTIAVEGGILSRSWTPDETIEDIKKQNKSGGLK